MPINIKKNKVTVDVDDDGIAIFQTADESTGVIFAMGFLNIDDFESGIDDGPRVEIDLSRLSTIDYMLDILNEAKRRLESYNSQNTTPM